LQGIFIAFIVSSTFGSHFKIDFMWWYFGAAGALQLITESEVRKVALQRRREAALAASEPAEPALSGI
jgi:hypothetical protein